MLEDVPASVETSRVVVAGARLSLADVPVGKPLEWPIVTSTGAMLLDIGAILPTDTARQFLFSHFEPCRQEMGAEPDKQNPTAPDTPTELFTLDDIGLKIGARLGLRRAAGSSMYSSRVIGFSSAPNRPRAVFITQPVMSGQVPLAMSRGEKAELVAITPRAVFHFACTVDTVCHEPFAYYVLSEPGAIRRLRARKFMRMSTHLPARFADASSDDASLEIGVIRDVSPFGMSLSVPESRATLGDRLNLSFNFHTDETDVEINCRAIVRHVNPVDAHGANGSYGLEFETLEPSQRIALKSYMAEQS